MMLTVWFMVSKSYLFFQTNTITNSTTASVADVDSDIIDENAVLEMLACRPPFPEFDLRTLLSTSPQGNSILSYYQKNKQLTGKHRNTLTDIISRRIFTRIVNQ
jgi:hypothetical protein